MVELNHTKKVNDNGRVEPYQKVNYNGRVELLPEK